MRFLEHTSSLRGRPKKQYSDERIAFALRQAEGGAAFGEACRKMGITAAAFTAGRGLCGDRGVGHPTAKTAR
ncbi:transposase [Aurantimonas sp. NFXS3]|uniref:transposase n=1 Tax=Aurantimonas sp. NFXS3 TaxID=2818434 RepID=UPI003BA0B22E